MTRQRSTSYHREVSSRNVEAILDAAEELLRQEGHATISAVAAAAGVSRVTVYAHFPTWEALLEAAVERAVQRVMAALEEAHPEDGPPVEALERVLARGWQHLAGYQAMAEAVAELLTPEAVTRTHQAAHRTIASLLARGQADGSFRTDLPADWLVHATIALIHTCNDGVRAGRIDPGDALRILTTSIRDLFTGVRGRRLSGCPRTLSDLALPTVQPLTEQEIRAAFVNCSKGEAKRLNVPHDLASRPWDDLDFLGWRDPQAPERAYLVARAGGRPVAIRLRCPAPSHGQRRSTMCSICMTTHAGGVSLMVAALSGSAGQQGNSVGTYICSDLDCSLYTRGKKVTASSTRLPEPLSLEEKIERNVANLGAFIAKVTG